MQDDYATQASLRYALSEGVRIGVELRSGAPNYRFIEARPFQDEGYVTSVAIPVVFRIAQEEPIQLYGLARAGLRFQGVIDPDENDQRDSIFSSTAALGEVGLLLQIPCSDRVAFQSGVTFPFAYELSPGNLLENMSTQVHGGVSVGFRNTAWFLNGAAGPAFGASGDTHKFNWAVQMGFRIRLSPGSSFSLLNESSL